MHYVDHAPPELAHGINFFDHFVHVYGDEILPEKALQLVARQLLRGLAHAQLRGIALDFKIENILLKNSVTRDDWEQAKDAPDAAIQLKIKAFGFESLDINACPVLSLGCILHSLACREYSSNHLRVPVLPAHAGLKAYSAMFQDLTAKLLHPDSETRITALDALWHPWVQGEAADCATEHHADTVASISLDSPHHCNFVLKYLDDLPFEQRKLRILNEIGLPEVINLGQFTWNEEEDVQVEDFKPLTAEELRQLILKLHTHHKVKVLALGGNEMGKDLMIELAMPLKMLKTLQYLYLWNNNIGNEGLTALSQSIRGLMSLKTLWMQGNGGDVSNVCHMIPYLLNLPQLSTVHLDHVPRVCVRDNSWQLLNLAKPPDEVIKRSWGRVLEFCRGGQCVSVHELRLMLIGDGEVGKSSLQSAFHAPSHRAKPILKEHRTVGIDFSELQFTSSDGPTVKCQVCDFAGQEIYYFSHTMHFTRRCLYVLVWTAHKFSESGTAQKLAVADIVEPLKRWLQLIAANVPEASIVVVGTHCQVDPQAFDAMRTVVEVHVREELERLCFIAVAESVATRQVLQRLQDKEHALYNEIKAELSTSAIRLAVPMQELKNVKAFAKQLGALQPAPKRGMMLKVGLLLDVMLEAAKTKDRLCRLHGVYDGTLPDAALPVAQLSMVHNRSFAVDSITGVGVAELLAAVEMTCRDRHALPFMGEEVPLSWKQVSEALHQDGMKDIIGDCVLPCEEAAKKVCVALAASEDVDVKFARHLDGPGMQSCLRFWSLLGRVFVYDGHFLRDPCRLVDFLKPLIHHNVDDSKFGFRKQFLVNPTDISCDRYLQQLHKHAVLDHRLLPHLKVWASSVASTHPSMLQFFMETFMISAIRTRNTNECHAYAEPQRSLVTARLFYSRDGEMQQGVDAFVDDIAHHALFHALYALPSVHVGIMAQMMATVEALQPSISFIVKCTQNSVCIQHGPSQCAIYVRCLSDVFLSKLGSIKDELPSDLFSHALLISSNDDGLFAFSARCVDAMMRSGNFGAMYQCWLPYRSFSADVSWRPKREDWVEVNSPENLKSLSEVLTAHVIRHTPHATRHTFCLQKSLFLATLSINFPFKSHIFVGTSCRVSFTEYIPRNTYNLTLRRNMKDFGSRVAARIPASFQPRWRDSKGPRVHARPPPPAFFSPQSQSFLCPLSRPPLQPSAHAPQHPHVRDCRLCCRLCCSCSASRR